MSEPLRDAGCRLCPLWETCSGTVCIPGDGPLDAEVLVLGIAPGRKEAQVGLPFQGDSGKLLRGVVEENGLVVRYTNVARCRAPENRDPSAAEQKTCRVYLDSEIAAMPNLRYVIALGSIPMKAMGVQGSVTEFAGVPRKAGFDYPSGANTVIPVFHPAAVLRRQTYLSTWESHWHSIKAIVHPPKESFAEKVKAVIYPNGLEGKDWRKL